MTVNCPLCHAPLPAADTVTVTVSPPAVRAGDRFALIPELNAILLECLAASFGRVVLWDVLIAYLWSPRDEPDDPRMIIRSLVYQARTPLAQVGLELVSVHGQGYFMRWSVKGATQ